MTFCELRGNDLGFEGRERGIKKEKDSLRIRIVEEERGKRQYKLGKRGDWKRESHSPLEGFNAISLSIHLL